MIYDDGGRRQGRGCILGTAMVPRTWGQVVGAGPSEVAALGTREGNGVWREGCSRQRWDQASSTRVIRGLAGWGRSQRPNLAVGRT